MILDEICRGQHAGMVRTGATFQQAADEYLRYIEQDRARKPSTVAGYRALVRAQLLPAFGELPVESITTPMVESWIAGLEVAPATRTNVYVLMGGIMKRARKVYGLPFNPVTDVEKPPAPQASGDIEVFSPEEVMRWSTRPPPSRTPRSTSLPPSAGSVAAS